MAARMFTNGWDFFAPPETVCFHLWSRAHRPTFRENRSHAPRGEMEDASRARVLRFHRNETRYGLGASRDIGMFEKAVGVRFRDRTVLFAPCRTVEGGEEVFGAAAVAKRSGAGDEKFQNFAEAMKRKLSQGTIESIMNAALKFNGME